MNLSKDPENSPKLVHMIGVKRNLNKENEMKNYSCSFCNGSGSQFLEEYNFQVEDACYHCLGSGKVNESTMNIDKEVELSMIIAEKMVSNHIKWVDDQEEGEGFSFSAAENQMTTWDYRMELVWRKQEVVQKQLIGLPKDILEALKCLLTKETPELKDNKVKETPVFDENLPF